MTAAAVKLKAGTGLVPTPAVKPPPPAAPSRRGRQVPLTPMRTQAAKSMSRLADRLQKDSPDLPAHQHLRDAARMLRAGHEEASQRHLRAAMFSLTPQSLMRNGQHTDEAHTGAREAMHGVHRHLLLVKDISDVAAKNQEAIRKDSGDGSAIPPPRPDPNAGYGPGANAQKPTVRQPPGDQAMSAPDKADGGGSDPSVADPGGTQAKGPKQFSYGWGDLTAVIELATRPKVAELTGDANHIHIPGSPVEYEHGYVPLTAAAAAAHFKGSVPKSWHPPKAAGSSPEAAAARKAAASVRLERGLTRGQKEEAGQRLYKAASHLDAGNHGEAAAELDAAMHATSLRGGGIIKGSTAAQARDLRDKVRAGQPAFAPEAANGMQVTKVGKSWNVRENGVAAGSFSTRKAAQAQAGAVTAQRAGLAQAEEDDRQRTAQLLVKRGLKEVDPRELKPGDQFTTAPGAPLRTVTEAHPFGNGNVMVTFEKDAHTPEGQQVTPLGPGQPVYGPTAKARAAVKAAAPGSLTGSPSRLADRLNMAGTPADRKALTAQMGTGDLKKVDDEFTFRAGLLGKAGQVSGAHKAVQDELQGRGTGLAHTWDDLAAVIELTSRLEVVDLVGPAGYIHGWIFVGIPVPGQEVYHPQHGKGTVTDSGGGRVQVSFDAGHSKSFPVRSDQGPGHFEQMTDDELAAEYNRSEGSRASAVTDELDRRDQRDADQKAQRVSALYAEQPKSEADRNRVYQSLVNEGESPEDAWAHAHGTDAGAMHKQAVIAQLRSQGYKGGGFDALTRDAFKDEIRRRTISAEGATNGYMLGPAGKKAGIDPWSLFTGPESRARKYASPELKEWWDQNGRPAAADFQANLMGQKAGAGRRDFYASVTWDDVLAVIDLSAKTAALEVTPAPRGKPGGPGLYDVKGNMHSPYFQNVVKALIEKRGMPPGKAYAIAWGAMRKWSKGGGKVSPEVRAAAAGGLGLEKAAEARAHGHAVSWDDVARVIEMAAAPAPAAAPAQSSGTPQARVPAGQPGAGQWTSAQQQQAVAGHQAGATASQKHMAYIAHLRHLAAIGKATPAQTAQLAVLMKTLGPAGKATPAAKAKAAAVPKAPAKAKAAVSPKAPKAAATPKAAKAPAAPKAPAAKKAAAAPKVAAAPKAAKAKAPAKAKAAAPGASTPPATPPATGASPAAQPPAGAPATATTPPAAAATPSATTPPAASPPAAAPPATGAPAAAATAPPAAPPATTPATGATAPVAAPPAPAPPAPATPAAAIKAAQAAPSAAPAPWRPRCATCRYSTRTALSPPPSAAGR